MLNFHFSDESSKLDMAAGGATSHDPGHDPIAAATDSAISAATSAIADVPIEIDEGLFEGDDLLDVEEELETLDLDV